MTVENESSIDVQIDNSKIANAEKEISNDFKRDSFVKPIFFLVLNGEAYVKNVLQKPN